MRERTWSRRTKLETDAFIVTRTNYLTPTGCWEWTGRIGPWGYGSIGVFDPKTGKNEQRSVHRVIYIDLFGPVPPGWEIDHLCSNRRCVNPNHLEAVPKAENVRRGAKNKKPKPVKMVCKYGHDKKLTSSGVMVCATCQAAAERRSRAKRGGLVGVGPGFHQKSKTECSNGHALTPENVYLNPSGWRSCRECRRANARKTTKKRVADVRSNRAAYLEKLREKVD